MTLKKWYKRRTTQKISTEMKMKTTVFIFVFLLAAYHANGLSLSPNVSQHFENENGDMNFSPRVGGNAVSSKKYPFMALAYSGQNFQPCSIVNKYFCLIVRYIPDFIPPGFLEALTIKTGVEDAASNVILGSPHYATSVTRHPKTDQNIVENMLAVIKVCPPFDEPAVIFPAKAEVLSVGTKVLTVGYTADGDGKELLREVNSEVSADDPCVTSFGTSFVAGKTICIVLSADAGVTSVEVNALVMVGSKAYGAVKSLDSINSVAMVQPFSHELDWIAANTVPL